ncbi:MlaE family lipid ABC transporter permease subunit [Marinihelvus fidelis]|uniref:MlaE family lipid ABC transporter permease subunit n=1 Tax=Marinihelvus fidelis TaxID=2613842 RepID=A0A5N0TFW3_9GAMM|nr:MlaE family lipid ABC transporter permease subunit [Marinihelvus fidelis]KAA9133374.1 MlaE family lipid ABC transporter permease subunit [Marinihelvus fidelis]
MDDSFLDFETRDDTLLVDVHGEWVFENVSALERASASVRDRAQRHVVFRCSGVESMDIAGAWVLYDRSQQLTEDGVTSEFENFRAAHFKFLRHIINMAALREPAQGLEPPGRSRAVQRALERVGEHSLKRIEDTGQWARWLFDALRRPSRLVIGETLQQVHQAGVRAIPVIMLMTFLIGIVLAYQGASQLEQFGARIFVVDMVSIALTREMAGLLAAVLVAGRSGSAFAAALGTMKLNEEVDAMRVLGLNPNQILILPRVLALLIALPALTVFADIAGLAGGALITIGALDITPTQFIERVTQATSINDVMAGLVKTPFFALLIAAVGTLRGLQVERSAEVLGRKTTDAVVQSIFLIICADAFFTTLFTRIGF